MFLASCTRLFAASNEIRITYLNDRPIAKAYHSARIPGNRAKAISNIVHILQKQEKRSKKYWGITATSLRYLGKLRATNALHVIVDYIDYIPTENVIIGEVYPTIGYYPVAMACYKIGKPSLPYMYSIIKDKDKNDTSKKIAAWVIYRVTSKEEAIDKLKEIEAADDSIILQDLSSPGDPNPSKEFIEKGKPSDFIMKYKLTEYYPKFK